MNNKTIDQLVNVISILSATAILLGAFFKLQHYPYGNQLVWGGFIIHFIFSSLEIDRLKKKIIRLEDKGLDE